MKVTSLSIISTDCVNSKWVASWLAKEGQEHCQCGFDCKVIVNIERNGHKPYPYVLNEKEFLSLKH